MRVQDALRYLAQGLEELKITDSDGSIAELLTKYIRELQLFNSAFNLVKVDSEKELVINHILDSLAPWKIFADRFDAAKNTDAVYRFADAGSGAGFPGIPLACLFLSKNPAVQFTLIERMQKRAAFLENVCAVLNLTNVSVLQCPIEQSPEHEYDIVAFRAFRPLDKQMISGLSDRVKSGAVLAAYKGKLQKITEEMEGIRNFIDSYTPHPVQVPFLKAERHLVLIQVK
ncbi:16S rRNA (guanine(527)-N(7))-methyltransferase RsmG [Treponema phagedenis]|uniref:Ribosomal RNA small subunit methyltransferase G n=1 Tax=Treponema phagedenis TaxID=162 RepID=A0A0B7GWR3_TREPH|nr:16S rRNA (guanine(527)-N(7))-methyltransferase RsmG [Treponema phagedenis]NVP25601.1 16S rRNA (guanine(527)-N(7))-methyltransferase RsmG [Treponema phagedenis]QEJ94321.1 16S rRNA (guanine(527)-N(7))-methyltransferase RsmG [Treponema phagedenis]QEJ99007.1 16S rRNA (guanine(527)-N(7))-methyltransferase RsmG [Treponema phagedenis]QEK07772.1 16S rRNA (guanine(527)-N(7))-methyltransferase RsmG [Treponema phagedenis]QKS91640.1 16S rRNA (guanine(527)-N(7))-methyltransferase RsmG [Treponema phagede